MPFEVDTSDAERGLLQVADFVDLLRRPVRETLRGVAELVRADAATAIRRRGRRSRPGESPSSDSGALLQSLRTRLARSRRADERAYTLAPEFYGFMLESGTHRILPRPFLVPAARRHVQDFVSRVETAISEAARQVSP